MAEALMIFCLVLAGPIAISATETATDGDFIELPESDFTQLVRWGIVRKATEAEENANKSVEVASSQAIDDLPDAGEPTTEEAMPVDLLPPAETEAPKETAAQKKKREAAEAKAAEELAAQEAAAAQELADKEAAEKLAETNEPAV